MITSNIASVIKKFESAKSRIPAAIEKSMNPDRYRNHLTSLAESTLRAIAEDGEAEAIPILVGSIAGGRIKDGFAFDMSATSANLDAWDPEQDGLNIEMEVIEQWVANFKEKDERDTYKSGRQMPGTAIAKRVMHSILADPDPWFSADREGHGALNPSGLVRFANLTRLPEHRIRFMLGAVLHVWCEFVREFAPATLRHNLAATFK